MWAVVTVVLVQRVWCLYLAVEVAVPLDRMFLSYLARRTLVLVVRCLSLVVLEVVVVISQ
jgi:hypothetical protein